MPKANELLVNRYESMLTFAFCTYNRAERLPGLVRAMRAQSCPVPFEILAINNNSSDDTVQVLTELARQPGSPLRWVTEPVQGIVAARNRGIAEAMSSDMLVYIDDDETPLPGLIAAAVDAILNEGAQCVGGKINVDLDSLPRPGWLEDDVLGFLGALDHGVVPLWIATDDTPLWSGNIAYDMRIFREDPDLRFDKRFDRIGQGLGGGEDAAMCRVLISRGARIRYRPDMVVLHAVEPWRLRRRYFLKLHYLAGVRKRYELPDFQGISIGGVPLFMLSQVGTQMTRTAAVYITRSGGRLRQAMNLSHAVGLIVGMHRRRAEASAHPVNVKS